MVDLGDRVVRAPVRAEPIRARLEIRLENGLEHQFQASLDHAVGDSGNTQLPEFSGITLWYHHLPYFYRPESARLQRIPDLAQERLDPDPGLDHGRGGLVDPCGLGAPAGGHAFPRVHQERRIVDEVEQVTEPAGGIISRPAVQLDLHTPYHDAGRELIRPGHGAGIPRRVFGHYFPSLTDTLPPFPMHAALPRSEYYGGSAPPAPSAGVAPIPASRPGRAAGVERTRVVPTFAVVRLTG